MEILNIDAARRRVINVLLNRGFVIKDLIFINEGRYCIVKANPYNILITYKRELFLSFGKMFKDEGESGAGDTINLQDLKMAISNEVQEIFTAFESGNIYKISMSDFLVNCKKWKSKEGKEERSVSIKLYERI